MKQQLDVENWNRKEHFFFFKQFEEPFFVQQSHRLHQSLCTAKAKISCFLAFLLAQNVLRSAIVSNVLNR
jgi:chloramphenicol O-acetyltransferase type A